MIHTRMERNSGFILSEVMSKLDFSTCYLIDLQYFPGNQVQKKVQTVLLLLLSASKIAHAPMRPRIFQQL